MRIKEQHVEQLARQEHEHWLDAMRRQGYHRTSYCSYFGHGCAKCNPGMVPYDELSEEAKESKRAGVRNLETDLAVLGYAIVRQSRRSS